MIDSIKINNSIFVMRNILSFDYSSEEELLEVETKKQKYKCFGITSERYNELLSILKDTTCIGI